MTWRDIRDGLVFAGLLGVLFAGWVVLCAAHGPLN